MGIFLVLQAFIYQGQMVDISFGVFHHPACTQKVNTTLAVVHANKGASQDDHALHVPDKHNDSQEQNI